MGINSSMLTFYSYDYMCPKTPVHRVSKISLGGDSITYYETRDPNGRFQSLVEKAAQLQVTFYRMPNLLQIHKKDKEPKTIIFDYCASSMTCMSWNEYKWLKNRQVKD